MSGRRELLAAIADDPESADLRRVYADWLEEHGDTLDLERARYIRLRLEWEARTDRHDREGRLLRRALADLREQHRAAWLGPLEALNQDGEVYLDVERGLPEHLAAPVHVFMNHVQLLRQEGEPLRHLTLYEVRTQAREVAGCPALSQFSELTLAGWLTPEDALALARSPHLKEIRQLTLWLGSRDDARICRTLLGSDALPILEEVVLYQFRGGIDTATEEDNQAAESLVAEIDRLRGSPVARVVRPWDRLFPLRAAEVGYNIFAGTLPGGQLGVVLGDWRCRLFRFDADGRFRDRDGMEEHDFHGILQPRSGQAETYEDEELLRLLHEEVGFEPALIGVREFYHPRLDLHLWPSIHIEVVQDPDVGLEHADYDIEQSIDSWLQGGNFVIEHGESYWADESGIIHTS